MSSRGRCWRSVDHGRHVGVEALDGVELLGADAVGLEAHQQVAPDAELILVLGRHAEQRTDQHGRDLGCEVLDEVEARAVAMRVEEPCAQLSGAVARAR